MRARVVVVRPISFLPKKLNFRILTANHKKLNSPNSLFYAQLSTTMDAHTLETEEDDRDGIRAYRPADLKQVQYLLGAGTLEQLAGEPAVSSPGSI